MSDSATTNHARGNLIDWFIHNKVAANILMLFLVFGGLLSVSSMRTQTLPDIDPRLVSVTVTYPGASPYEIADAVTRRVEESLKGIDGVKRIASTANEGFGVVNVELMDFADADTVYNEVETSVNSLQDFPPEDAERPIITHVKPTPQILRFALHGNVDEGTIKYWAESLEEDIRLLPGVTNTALTGVRDYQMSIEVTEENLRKYNLSFDRVAQIVRQFSVDVPGGTVESDSGDILLRVQDRKYTGTEFGDIVVATLADGASLYLRDIATVVDGFEDQNLIGRFDGEPAAFIEVMRNQSTDTLTAANTVLAYVDSVRLPAGLALTVQQNETTILKDRISLMLRNGIIGFVLVFVILTLFLDLKLAFWTSAAIPISFLGGLIILQALGFSISMMSLFALIVVLGIVVDDGIVTGEAIYEAQQRHPNDPNAVRKGVMEVIAPVTVGVATTMAAFGPLTMSTGTLGQIVKVAPYCVIAVLFISLIEAYFILPAHLSHPGNWSRGVMAKIRDRVHLGLTVFINNYLEPTVKFTLKWRYATLAFFVASAIIVVGLVQGGIIRFLFFPLIEGDRININVEMPIGTPFALTQATVLEMERRILDLEAELSEHSQYDPFESVATLIGQQGAGSSSPVAVADPGSLSSHLAQITIQLVPSDFRSLSAAQVEAKLRERIGQLPHVKRLEFQSSLVGDDPDINLELSHPNDDVLIEAAAYLTESISKVAGTVDITNSFELGKKEYVFRVNDEGLAVGLTPFELGQQLRSAFFGLEVLRYQRDGSEIIVYLRYPKADRENITTLGQTRIHLPNGNSVSLNAVADIIEQNGYSKIDTVNGKHIVSVFADIDTAISTPTEAISYLEQHTLPALLQRFPGLGYSFEGESRDQQEDVSSLARNMVIAGMIIFILLGAQLRSYVQPFIIMSAIPFGACGAVLGHMILGYDLTFISLFGMVALSGVVVNDSVVLVDYLNSHARAGKTLHESIVLAVKRRFRPILLTTLSTCMGLLPILTETSMQAQFLIPMVVSLATGLLFSTVVILFFVPCLIAVSADIKNLRNHIIGKLQLQLANA